MLVLILSWRKDGSDQIFTLFLKVLTFPNWSNWVTYYNNTPNKLYDMWYSRMMYLLFFTGKLSFSRPFPFVKIFYSFLWYTSTIMIMLYLLQLGKVITEIIVLQITVLHRYFFVKKIFNTHLFSKSKKKMPSAWKCQMVFILLLYRNELPPTSKL